MIAKLGEAFAAFYQDESGIDVGPILIIALIVVPLVILLILFKDRVIELFNTMFEALFGRGGLEDVPTELGG